MHIKLKGLDNIFGKMSVDEEAHAKKFKIRAARSEPTLRYYENGKAGPYTGGTSVDEMVLYVLEK